MPLLELRLAQNKEIVLLEREKIQEIFREQELSALLSAEGTAKRVALGKVLKADLLIVLEGEEKPQPHARVTICETRQGLRLCRELVEIGASPETDAAKLEPLIDTALKKTDEKITQIVAVPPLVSNDLGFGSQNLQRPLADVIEQSLLGRPGVLVVELAEAKAVADELAIEGKENLGRPLPLYLLGDFQQQPAGADRLSVHLKLLRGQKLLGEREMADIARLELAATLRREAAGLVDMALGQTAALPEPATEARQLHQRAIVMYQFMNFLEALELAEASLLLDPEQPDVHRLAAHSAGMHVSKLLRQAADTWHGSAAKLVQKVQSENEGTLRRGLPHLEYFMTHAQVSAARDRVVISGYFEGYPAKEDLRAMMLRVLAAKLAGKVSDDTVMYQRPFRKFCFQGATAEEVLHWKLEAARVWPRADAQAQLEPRGIGARRQRRQRHAADAEPSRTAAGDFQPGLPSGRVVHRGAMEGRQERPSRRGRP